MSGFKTRLNEAIERECKIASDSRDQGRLRRWWAKQRLRWLTIWEKTLTNILAKSSLALSAYIQAAHWQPESWWLKLCVFFDSLFSQLRQQWHEVLRWKMKELERLRNGLIAYGKKKHNGFYTEPQDETTIKGNFTHDEWIEKLSLLSQPILTRKQMTEFATEPSPTWLGLSDQSKTMQKYRRLIYFSRARRALEAILPLFIATPQTEKVVCNDSSSTYFWEELGYVVQQAELGGDNSNGIKMLRHILEFVTKHVTFSLHTSSASDVFNWYESCQKTYYEKQASVEKMRSTLMLKPKLLSRTENDERRMAFVARQTAMDQFENDFFAIFEGGELLKAGRRISIEMLPKAQALWQSALAAFEERYARYQQEAERLQYSYNCIKNYEKTLQSFYDNETQGVMLLKAAGHANLAQQFQAAIQACKLGFERRVLRNGQQLRALLPLAEDEYLQARAQQMQAYREYEQVELARYHQVLKESGIQTILEKLKEEHGRTALPKPSVTAMISAVSIPPLSTSTTPPIVLLTESSSRVEKRIPVEEDWRFICDMWGVKIEPDNTISRKAVRRCRTAWIKQEHPDRRPQSNENSDIYSEGAIQRFRWANEELVYLEDYIETQLKKIAGENVQIAEENLAKQFAEILRKRSRYNAELVIHAGRLIEDTKNIKTGYTALVKACHDLRVRNEALNAHCHDLRVQHDATIETLKRISDAAQETTERSRAIREKVQAAIEKKRRERELRSNHHPTPDEATTPSDTAEVSAFSSAQYLTRQGVFSSTSKTTDTPQRNKPSPRS